MTGTGLTLHGVAHVFLARTGQAWEDLEARYRQDSLAQVGARLGDEQFNRTYAKGMTLIPDEAFRLALGFCPPPRTRGSRQNRQAWPSYRPGNGNWSSWSPAAPPTRRSPPSCTSASAPSARTWTGSGTRPAAGAEPTSPAWPYRPAWSSPPVGRRCRRAGRRTEVCASFKSMSDHAV